MNYRHLTARHLRTYASEEAHLLSDPDMKLGRTWHEIATEMLVEQDPQRMTRLTEELDSALERDSANRVQSHQPPFRLPH